MAANSRKFLPLCAVVVLGVSACTYRPRVPDGVVACVEAADCPLPSDRCVPLAGHVPPLAVCCHDCPPDQPDAGARAAAHADADADVDADADADGPLPCPAAREGPTLVRVGPFCIDETEVTNAQYAVFWTARATGRDVTGQIPVCAWNMSYTPDTSGSAWPFLPGTERRPVVNVDWCDAYAYCRWAGKRLCGAREGGGLATWEAGGDPAVSQWAFACTAGGKQAFPYGETFDPAACNTGRAKEDVSSLVDVGSRPRCSTPGGALDLSGNVEEWTDACTGSAGASDRCAILGQSAYQGASSELACVQSAYPDARSVAYELRGFRCCAP